MNWQAADVVLPSDFNRIEGNINAIEVAPRTLDPDQTPSGNTGTLRQVLSWFANRIKAITGQSNWWQAPPYTLAGATSEATANRLVARDAQGRAQFADPAAPADVATKAYVDSGLEIGDYIGDGQQNRLIPIGWRPKFVAVYGQQELPDDENRWSYVFRFDGMPGIVNVGPVGLDPFDHGDKLVIVENGFRVSQFADVIFLNHPNVTHYWIAWR